MTQNQCHAYKALTCFFILIFCLFLELGTSKNLLFSEDTCEASGNVDLIAFSYNRPLQLYAFLESCEKYVQGIHEIRVIYRASAKDYAEGYKIVAQDFPNVRMFQQSQNPHADFKSLVLNLTYGMPCSCAHVLFAVDDILVKDYINLEECAVAMDNAAAWGFFFRLGKNITHCYMINESTPVPPGHQMTDKFFTWKFADGRGDWIYPNTVDMTLYRKRDIKPFFVKEDYIHPNSLEAGWAGHCQLERRGICYNSSKILNIPLNLVNISTNRNLSLYSAEDLLLKFQQGLKMDISMFHQIKNNSPHMDYEPKFIPRNTTPEEE